MGLTTKEKASRYDSLQVAIRFYLDYYGRERDAAFDLYKNHFGEFAEFNHGRAVALQAMTEVLKRWSADA